MSLFFYIKLAFYELYVLVKFDKQEAIIVYEGALGIKYNKTPNKATIHVVVSILAFLVAVILAFIGIYEKLMPDRKIPEYSVAPVPHKTDTRESPSTASSPPIITHATTAPPTVPSSAPIVAIRPNSIFLQLISLQSQRQINIEMRSRIASELRNTGFSVIINDSSCDECEFVVKIFSNVEWPSNFVGVPPPAKATLDISVESRSRNYIRLPNQLSTSINVHSDEGPESSVVVIRASQSLIAALLPYIQLLRR